MAYDEEQAKRSRVVVETPQSRREVVHSEAVRTPEREGVSSTMVGILVIVAIGLITLLVLFLMTGRTDEFANDNIAAQQQPVPQTTIIEQPAPQQPPIIIQQPAPVQPAPVIIQQPAPSGGEVQSDMQIQAEIDRQIAESETFSNLGVTATVVNGRVTLLGSVKSETLKLELERMIRGIRGVLQVENKLEVR